MKIGMTSFTLRDKNIEEVFECAKKAGLDGIEWGVGEHISLEDESFSDKVKELSKLYGIEIFSLGSYCDMTDRDDCDRVLGAAFRLGAPVIRLWAGRKSPE